MRQLLSATVLVASFFALMGERADAQLSSVYFEVITQTPEPGETTANSWYGAFEVANLSLAITSTSAVYLTTPFVGGLSSEPGFWFDSGADFVWQGDNNPPSANSTIRSQQLVDAINSGATWSNLFNSSFSLLSGVTTDLSALNPTAFRVSGQGGTITFSSSPIPEPSTLGLLGLSLLGLLGGYALKRRRG